MKSGDDSLDTKRLFNTEAIVRKHYSPKINLLFDYTIKRYALHNSTNVNRSGDTDWTLECFLAVNTRAHDFVEKITDYRVAKFYFPNKITEK